MLSGVDPIVLFPTEASIPWVAWELSANALGAMLVCAPLCGRSRGRYALAAVAGVGIDVDHAIAAHGFDVGDLLALGARPVGHSLLVVCLLALVVASMARRRDAFAIGGICCISLLSHLVRDASGGGTPLLWPFSTAQLVLPWLVYPLGLLVLLMVSLAIRRVRPATSVVSSVG